MAKETYRGPRVSTRNNYYCFDMARGTGHETVLQDEAESVGAQRLQRQQEHHEQPAEPAAAPAVAAETQEPPAVQPMWVYPNPTGGYTQIRRPVPAPTAVSTHRVCVVCACGAVRGCGDSCVNSRARGLAHRRGAAHRSTYVAFAGTAERHTTA
eukprot:6423856-Prymnesium_polylepis.1